MVTLRNGLALGLLGLAAAACSGRIVTGSASASEGAAPAPAAGAPTNAYDGRGFVVHEWGTNTIVTGTDGSLQRGLHHEEEDLPPFVDDRIGAGGPVEVKMETPVTYFYSDRALSARVSVAFPHGVLTQWYPHAESFYPPLAYTAGGELADPALDPRYPFSSATCAERYGQVANGLLDWGAVEVLARDTDVSSELPPAPLDRYTWSHARAVASNPLHVSGQAEKFLFYRGLGNAPLPATVRATGYDGGVAIENGYARGAIGTVFVLRVGGDAGAFVERREGIAPGARLEETAPALDGPLGKPLEAYTDALATAVTAALDETGLFHDEAAAMVATWKRQWFKTPGVRVLYLAPSAWIDEQIPLSIAPPPDRTVRVMMIRVEALTHAVEDTDLKFAADIRDAASASDPGAAHFHALGRFAEPRLRRAIALLGGSKNGELLLTQIAGANAQGAAGE